MQDAIHDAALLTVSGWQREALAPGPRFQIGQWVRSIHVGTAPSFVGQIIERADNGYVVRDDWRRRFVRTAEQLESLK